MQIKIHTSYSKLLFRSIEWNVSEANFFKILRVLRNFFSTAMEFFLFHSNFHSSKSSGFIFGQRTRASLIFFCQMPNYSGITFLQNDHFGNYESMKITNLIKYPNILFFFFWFGARQISSHRTIDSPRIKKKIWVTSRFLNQLYKRKKI